MTPESGHKVNQHKFQACELTPQTEKFEWRRKDSSSSASKTALHDGNNTERNFSRQVDSGGSGCYCSSSPISSPPGLCCELLIQNQEQENFRQKIDHGKFELGTRCILTDLSNLEINDIKSEQNSNLRKTLQLTSSTIKQTQFENIPEISEFQISDEMHSNSNYECHSVSLECLLSCTEWSLDVLDYSIPDKAKLLAQVQNPKIAFKHCTVYDQNDALDDLVDGQCNQYKNQDINSSQYLSRMATTFPLQNKTKGQNTQITNFERENKIKEETFMLTFPLEDLQLQELAFLDRDTAKKTFMFNINGIVHGKQVFQDVIFYMVKGGKMVNCLLSKINRQLLNEVDSFLQTGQINQNFPDRFNFKMKDLPKSFGCQVSLFVDKQSRSFSQLNRRLFQLVHDHTGQSRQICDQQPYPFTVSNLADFNAHINSFSFVFNINETLLKENEFYNVTDKTSQIGHELNNSATNGQNMWQQNTEKQKMLLSPHLLTILNALKFKSTFDVFNNQTYKSNFEIFLTSLQIPDTKTNDASRENAEERGGITKLVLSLFNQVSCFGLKLQYYIQQQSKPIKLVYVPTLSLVKFKRTDGTYYEFCQNQPPHMRNLFIEDFLQHVKLKDEVYEGYFAVLFTQQRISQSQDETSFLAYYSMNSAESNIVQSSQKSVLNLIGIYPSRDLFTPNQISFWFKNNQLDDQDPYQYFKHELNVKTLALNQFVAIQQLIQDEIGIDLQEINNPSLDLITMHRDFLFMQRQHKLVQLQPDSGQKLTSMNYNQKKFNIGSQQITSWENQIKVSDLIFGMCPGNLQ